MWPAICSSPWVGQAGSLPISTLSAKWGRLPACQSLPCQPSGAGCQPANLYLVSQSGRLAACPTGLYEGQVKCKCNIRPRFAPCAFLALPLLILTAACAPAPQAAVLATPTVHYRAPTYGEITPGPHKYVPDLSTTIEVPPFPYGAPLPPAVPSVLDGLYSRRVPFEGTPVPCKRCAGYRLEGGLWSLYLDKGVFKVFQQDTDFEAVGSYTVTGDAVSFFNDPYCEEDLGMTGHYNWAWDARSALRLQVVDDPCSIGLRAKNLTFAPWVKTPLLQSERDLTCQPPTREAAITDHWNKPPYCP